jgi:uncharacterized membrane protein YgdD (TMEM256/DUF423 family)
MWTWWFSAGSLLSALGIAAGAFGAHAMKSRLTPEDLAIFDTASRYLGMQSMGLIGISLCMARLESATLKYAAAALLIGIIIFSGSLYALVGTGIRWLGAITPIGGAMMILAWILAAFACTKATFN